MGRNSARAGGGPEADDLETPPQRIVSLAPNITETLFALGLGSRVVGVTRYCDFPPEAARIAKVGDLVDPSYEAILSLKPDLVILLSSHREARRELAKMGIRSLAVPHESVADVHETIRLVGQACGARGAADSLMGELAGRSEAVRKAVGAGLRPRVMLCIGRDTDSGQLSAIHVAGRGGFHDEIIAAAGGSNAYQDDKAPYPQISAEGIIRLAPDVIVDLLSPMQTGGQTPDRIKQQWSRLHTVAAVREGRVYVIAGNHALRPGPRYVEFLEQLARVLHPKAFDKGAPDG